MERYFKDPDLKGIYVKRCKCGARPSLDRDVSPPTTWWIGCNCGRNSEPDVSKQKTIDNWNDNKLIYT
jgi:hypothetical protein